MRRAAILALLTGAAAPAVAQDFVGPTGYGSAGYAYQGALGYPLSLPQTLRATLSVPLRTPPGAAAGTLHELYPLLAACWAPPVALGPGVEITARLALRRDGSLLGTPRITYAAGVAGSDRAVLTRATLDALSRCTPVPLTAGLGGAVAGRPVALRLVYRPATDPSASTTSRTRRGDIHG